MSCRLQNTLSSEPEAFKACMRFLRTHDVLIDEAHLISWSFEVCRKARNSSVLGELDLDLSLIENQSLT